MRKIIRMSLMLATVAMIMASIASTTKAQTVYTVLNDDVPLGYNGQFNSGSLFVDGTYQSKISTGSYGIGGGYLGIHSADIDILDSANECLFLADAGGVSGSGPGDIFAYNVAARTGANVVSNFGYNGNLYGIGFVHSGNVLAVEWSGSGEIETFTIGAGCSLTSSKSSASGIGLGGGTADGIAIAPNGKFVVATYEDGSYGYYPLSGATISAPSQYNSSCFENTNLFGVPVGIAISPDSSIVYLDCLVGSNGAVIDVFTAANPGVTITNGPLTAAGGTPINGSVTMDLSKNGKILYIVGTFSGSIESTDVSGTAVMANSCSNVTPPGYNSQWIYPGTIDVLAPGAGSVAAIPETAFGNTPDSYVELLKIDSQHCLTAFKQGTDANSMFALSGASHLKP